METGTSHELAQVADYSFLEFESLEKLRSEQTSELKAAASIALSELHGLDAFISGGQVRSEAEKRLTPELDEKLESFLDARLSKTTNPDHYNQVFALLRSVSAHNMNDAKWYNGDRGTDGNYDYTTSGRYQAEKLLEELQSTTTNSAQAEETDSKNGSELDAPAATTSQEIEDARTSLLDARATLAGLSVARRKLLRQGGKVPKELAAQYADAEDAYKAACDHTTSLYVAHYREEGLDEQEIFHRLAPMLIKVIHHDFTEDEYQHLTSDNSLRSRAARFLAKRGALIGLSVASGFAIGVGARAVSKSAIMAAIGITGGAAAGALLAIRTTRNILLAKVKNEALLNKEFEKRRAADQADIDDFMERDFDTSNAEAALQTVTGRIGEIITDRVEKDRKSNQRRAVMATLIGGAAAAAAFEFGPDVRGGAFGHRLHGIFGIDGDDDKNYVPSISDHTPASPPVMPVPVHPPVDNYGFNPHVYVEQGHGYIKELQDLAAQKGVHLTGAQATEAWQNLHGHVSDTTLMSTGNYHHGGDLRISHPGYANWNHAALANFNQWLLAQQTAEKSA